MKRPVVAICGIIVLAMWAGTCVFVFQDGALSAILEARRVSLEESALSSPEEEQGQEVFLGTQANMDVTEGTVEASPPQPLCSVTTLDPPCPPYPEGSFGAFLDNLDRKMTSLQLQARMENLEGETMDWEGRVFLVGERLSQLSVVIEHPDEPDNIGLSRQALLWFSQSHKEELLKLNTGDIIKVRCKFLKMWYGGPHMKDCELL